MTWDRNDMERGCEYFKGGSFGLKCSVLIKTLLSKGMR